MAHDNVTGVKNALARIADMLNEFGDIISRNRPEDVAIPGKDQQTKVNSEVRNIQLEDLGGKVVNVACFSHLSDVSGKLLRKCLGDMEVSTQTTKHKPEIQRLWRGDNHSILDVAMRKIRETTRYENRVLDAYFDLNDGKLNLEKLETEISGWLINARSNGLVTERELCNKDLQDWKEQQECLTSDAVSGIVAAFDNFNKLEKSPPHPFSINDIGDFKPEELIKKFVNCIAERCVDANIVTALTESVRGVIRKKNEEAGRNIR